MNDQYSHDNSVKDLKHIDSKRKTEKNVLELMIRLYCKGNKHSPDGLCPDCQDLLDYSCRRVDNCPFMETKTFCQNCKVHCYKSDMKEQIRTVMRYSGPKMIFHHPIIAIKHLIESKKEKND